MSMIPPQKPRLGDLLDQFKIDYSGVKAPVNQHDAFKDVLAMQEMMKSMMGVKESREFSGESASDIQKTLDKRVEWLDNELQNIKLTKQLLEKAKFSVGDTAFIKDVGNVLIKEIYVDGMRAEGGPSVKYLVTTLQGDRHYDVSQVLPCGEATKILYKKATK